MFSTIGNLAEPFDGGDFVDDFVAYKRNIRSGSFLRIILDVSSLKTELCGLREVVDCWFAINPWRFKVQRPSGHVGGTNKRSQCFANEHQYLCSLNLPDRLKT